MVTTSFQTLDTDYLCGILPLSQQWALSLLVTYILQSSDYTDRKSSAVRPLDSQSPTNQTYSQQPSPEQEVVKPPDRQPPTNPEHKVFTKMYSTLHRAIIYQADLNGLIAELYSQRFISLGKFDVNQPQQTKCELLLGAVRTEIENNAPRFYDFLSILQQDSSLETVCKTLEEEIFLAKPSSPFHKFPPLFDYTEPLEGKEFDHLCGQYRNAIMSNNLAEVDRLTEHIMADEKMDMDIKIFTRCYQALAKAAVPYKQNEVKSILEHCLQLADKTESQNTPLLKGRAYRMLAGLSRQKMNYKEGLAIIDKGKQALSCVVPSCETSCLLVEEAQLLQLYEELTPQRQDKIEGLLEQALKQAWNSKDRSRSRYTVSLVHLQKSAFYLNIFVTNSSTPIPEANLVMAEECLRKVELELVGGNNRYQIRYHVAWSALHQYRNNPREALMCIRKANDLLKYSETEDSYLRVRERCEILEKLVKTRSSVCC